MNKTILILTTLGAIGLALVLTPMVRQPAVQSLPIRNLGTQLEPGRLTFRRADNGSTSDARPRITNVNITDLDADGAQDLLICDSVRHTVWWRHRTADTAHNGVAIWENQALREPAP
ncbi:MAG: hypothetical protein GY903_27495 [Fuerstiella sp.]|nr:hypothetical protein [Fuerstiella sp.]MCP4858243.1 hypothetical protein [Fuerstiella sp.]